ncbi:MAG: hypothetical protein ACK5AO_08000 [bacterium]|jgi:hypothetical protein
MKRMIMSIAMVLTAFLSQAAVSNSFEKAKEIEKVISKSNAEQQFNNKTKVNGECSVTMKGTIDLGPIEAEVSCTTTASTCQKATMMAISCLSAAVKTVRTIVM